MAIKYGTNSSDSLGGSASTLDQIFGWDADNAPGDEGPAGDNDDLFMEDGDLGNGGAGDDLLRTRSDTDKATLIGGAGDDTLQAVNGQSNHIYGGDGIDLWDSSKNTIFGLDFGRAYNVSVADLMAGVTFDRKNFLGATEVSGIDRIKFWGSAFDDRITGGDYADTIYGNQGKDFLRGGGGDDLLVAGNTSIFEDNGYESLFGGSGDDTLDAVDTGTHITLRGGAGVDLLVFAAFDGSDSVVTVSGDMRFKGGSTAIGFERISYFGGTGADRLTGGALDDTLDGGFGNDVLMGLEGNDFLAIRLGDNRAATQLLDGGAGDDTIDAELGANVHLIGGAGTDLWGASFLTSGQGVEVTATDVVGSYALTGGGLAEGFERVNITGSRLNDTLTGGDLGETILGASGDDLIRGGNGDDSLMGGDRSDTIYGGAGNDTLSDHDGANILVGGDGDDRILVTGDALRSYAYGGAGDDVLRSGPGGNNLNGGAGSDSLFGSNGVDKFIFNTAPVAGEVDVITYFGAGAGKDEIVLFASAFDGLQVGDLTAGQFVLGTRALDADDRILYDAAGAALWYDADGKGGAAAVKFAQFDQATVAPTFADFTVV